MIPVMIIAVVVGVCVGWCVWRETDYFSWAVWFGFLAALAAATITIGFEKLLSEGIAGRIPLWWLF